MPGPQGGGWFLSQWPGAHSLAGTPVHVELGRVPVLWPMMGWVLQASVGRVQSRARAQGAVCLAHPGKPLLAPPIRDVLLWVFVATLPSNHDTVPWSGYQGNRAGT